MKIPKVLYKEWFSTPNWLIKQPNFRNATGWGGRGTLNKTLNDEHDLGRTRKQKSSSISSPLFAKTGVEGISATDWPLALKSKNKLYMGITRSPALFSVCSFSFVLGRNRQNWNKWWN